MKRFTPLLSLALVAMLAGHSAPVAAQTTNATVALNPSSEAFVYHSDFDILALDFTITSTAGDALKALTVATQGSARPGFEFNKPTLWADAGVPGFQGWGYDVVLGDATNVNGMWVFTNLSSTFTQTSKRFFVSIESSSNPDEKIIAFQLMNGGENGDGVYQNGEQGIFLQSGVIATVPTPANSHNLRFKDTTGDLSAPKAFLANTSVNQSAPTIIVNNGQQITLSGQARDRSGGTVNFVDLDINGQVVPATLASQANSTTWTLAYTPVMAKDDLTIKLIAKDGTGKSWTSEAYYLTVDSRLAVSGRSSITSDVAVIDDNGSDSALITVTVRDGNGDPLPQRAVTFSSQHADDKLSAISVQTDVSGLAKTMLTSTLMGVTQVTAKVGDIVIGSVNVMVGEDSSIPFPEEPEDVENPEFGQLIKGSQPAVYYYGNDGKRHVFVQLDIYASWYGTDFSGVHTISDADLAAIPLGVAVPFKPGTLIKVPSIPDVYVIDVNQTLRHITSETIARELFGTNWNKQIHDLSEALLTTYSFGEPIMAVEEFDPSELVELGLTIDSELDA